ncbi:hypothetical protein [Oceanobacillus massiliensis]|uniref:hypothetical protein n=1 Tax=Oceanobacillus massiliensis TaxID=1465765 RepID=UPI00301813CF
MRFIIMIFYLLCSALLFTACANNENDTGQTNNTDSAEIENISNQSLVSQQPANHAKELLSKHEEITAINAVNTKDNILIAVEVEHHERFTLAQLRKKFQKEMEDEFKDMKVEFSTDRKIVLELEKLEKDIRNDKLSNKELEKKVKKIVKLAKEQT